MSAREEALRSLNQTSANIARERKELEAEEEQRIRDLAATYPSIAPELWAHYERMKTVTSDQFLSFDEWKQACSREYWTYLKLLESVEPGLPVTEMHDQIEAQLEAVQRSYMERAVKIEAIAEESRRDIRDLALAFHTGDQDEIDHITAKYPTSQ